MAADAVLGIYVQRPSLTCGTGGGKFSAVQGKTPLTNETVKCQTTKEEAHEEPEQAQGCQETLEALQNT